MESLRHDVEPFNIRTTIVQPGFFRTELLVDASTTWAELSVDDYAERTAATKKVWESMNGQQAGDPVKLAEALLTIAGQEQPPARFVAGADAIEAVAEKARGAAGAGRGIARAGRLPRPRRRCLSGSAAGGRRHRARHPGVGAGRPTAGPPAVRPIRGRRAARRARRRPVCPPAGEVQARTGQEDPP
ncbi:hypothetical protein ACVWXU_008324 [Streptomyces sp. TE33382]